jgi:hypothetical protein
MAKERFPSHWFDRISPRLMLWAVVIAVVALLVALGRG